MSGGQQAKDSIDKASGSLTNVIDALNHPEAFPQAAPADGVGVIQTHISIVFLVGQWVYKIKKPLNLGFLDYSTPAARRRLCQEEVRLNTRLAPHVYEGIASLLALPDGRLRFSATLPAPDAPLPGAEMEGGVVIDYAVVMRRLPEEATLAARVANGTITLYQVKAAAQRVAAFHATTEKGPRLARFGATSLIAANWEENLTQMTSLAASEDRLLDSATLDRIAAFAHQFPRERATLFAERQRGGSIRDCHGDLRLQHVYVDDPGGEVTIVDCIEFAERYRVGDVAAEVAFLVMELDAAGRTDLSRAFACDYVDATGDTTLLELLPFYACYRACVRAKVLAMQSSEPEIPAPNRDEARRQAALLFALAGEYARMPTYPILLMIGGLMGTGKSTLAAALHRGLGWPVLSSDSARKRLATTAIDVPLAHSFECGLYSPAWTARTYAALRDEAVALLRQGHSVIIDATFSRRADRAAQAEIAGDAAARAYFIECACSPAIALERLERRWQARNEGRKNAATEASAASDGRPELYEAQRTAWEPLSADEKRAGTHAMIDTTASRAKQVAEALDLMRLPPVAYWLTVDRE